MEKEARKNHANAEGTTTTINHRNHDHGIFWSDNSSLWHNHTVFVVLVLLIALSKRLVDTRAA